MRIELLGGFRVEGAEVAWPTRRAAELVALLALADGHRLPRERVIEALWPRLGPDSGAAQLRKAAHHARQVLGPDAIVLRGGHVALVGATTDVEAFESGGDPGAYAGDLLPDAPYEDWAQAPRERLRARYLEALRARGDWEGLVAADPTDEPAHRELMRRALAEGSRPAAIRWYGRLRTALRRELRIAPAAETEALYEQCVAGLREAETAHIGRQLELARIAAALRAEPPGVLALRGPAGIGKSALCRELARLAVGWKVVGVTATEAGGPYAPLIAVAQRLRAGALLAQLASEPTRHQVIGAFRRALLAAGERVLLIVDDAHLADEATVDVLGHLDGPILLALAYRPQPSDATLTRVVARLERAGRVTALDLAPLERDEAAALAAAGATTPRDRATVERIVALGEGNPFLVLELARSSVVGVPALVATVSDAVTSRFLDLDDATLAALRRLALAADDLDPAGATALIGTEDAAFAVLDTALASGVLVVHEGRYRFRHELVRQALMEQLSPHARIAAHREAAERLAGAGEPALVARHWLAGERPAEALPWLLEAARGAIRLGAYADALNVLDELLEHEPRHAEALTLRAESLDARGDSRAPAAYAAAADVVGSDDLRARGALATIKLGDAQRALELAEGLEPVSLEGRIAWALTFAGAAALGFGDPVVGSERAAWARELALASGDEAAVAVASWAQAAAAHARGDLRDSVRADLRETHALPELAVSAFDGQLCITQRLLYGARPYPDVIAFADSLEAEAERLGAERGRAFAVTIRGEARLLSGDLDGADADLREGVRLHRELRGATGEAFALQRRAEVAMHRGQRAQAHALLDEALAIARESDVGFHLFDRIYGTRIELAEDKRAALEEAEAAVRGPIETCPGCRITLAVPAAIAAARAGDRERADEWLQATEYLAEVVMRLPAWHAALEEVRGHRADGDTAASHFRRAAEGYGAAGQPLDEARCAALASIRVRA